MLHYNACWFGLYFVGFGEGELFCFVGVGGECFVLFFSLHNCT